MVVAAAMRIAADQPLRVQRGARSLAPLTLGAGAGHPAVHPLRAAQRCCSAGIDALRASKAYAKVIPEPPVSAQRAGGLHRGRACRLLIWDTRLITAQALPVIQRAMQGEARPGTPFCSNSCCTALTLARRL